MDNYKYKVSVRLMCYNQEKFIRAAMDSIFMQKVDFPVEVVVGDDFSGDETLNIIRGYKDTEFITVRVLERKVGDEYWKARKERGRLFNYLDILRNCNGKYIALLDGDDYWTDELKLKKQVDFLERNPGYSIVSHEAHTSKFNVKNSYNGFVSILLNNYRFGNIKNALRVLKLYFFDKELFWNSRVTHSKSKRINPYTFRDILEYKHFMATSSIMFRAGVVGKIGDWYTESHEGHYFIVLIALCCGKGYHFNRFMSFHRLHEGSVSQDQQRLARVRPRRQQSKVHRLGCLLEVARPEDRGLVEKQLNELSVKV